MNAPHVAFRPSAIPLVTVDPYFSIWSMADALPLDHTRHWTGRRNAMIGSVRLDGVPYRFLGLSDNDETAYRRTDHIATLSQTSLRITPTATVAVLENELLVLEVTFRSPLLLSRPELLSRPITYVSWRARFKDGAPHEFQLYFDVTADAVVSNPAQTVTAEKTALGCRIGRCEQTPLSRSGDDLTIDWGYLHLVHPDASPSTPMRRRIFHGDRRRAETAPESRPYAAREGLGVAVESDQAEGMLLLAYDDLGKSIRYFDEELGSYYLLGNMTFDEMLADSLDAYREITAACDAFDAEMLSEMRAISEDYAEVGALVYRQAIAAHKLVKSERDGLLFLSKECFSNGCIATLDVTYPSIPLFLRYAPSFVRGMMTPILRFAASDAWPYEYAPHDCGQYPFCTGQVYGKRDGKLLHEMQMPVEECGNALLTVTAVCRAEGSTDYARENESLLTGWAEYLMRAGYNPENQLCTDDFAGRLAQNCNLSVKAIVALGAYGDLLGIPRYVDAAREMAARWCNDAKTALGTRLTFDNPDSWSLKYNLVWDRLFGLGLFPEEIYCGEIESYRAHMNRYGVPLDSRRTYTKLDWEMWTTVLTNDAAYRAEVIRSIRRTVCETPSRVPVSDWYETLDGMQVGFQNRTVLGGYFIPQLVGFFK